MRLSSEAQLSHHQTGMLFKMGEKTPQHITFVRFLQQDQGVYQSKVRDMISENKGRLIVNINDLRRRNEARAAK